MEANMRSIGSLFGKLQTKECADYKVIAELEEVMAEIENVESKFNLTTDQDLLDSIIYERIALFSRYRYLIKLAKEKGLKGRLVSKIDRFEGMNTSWN